MLGVRPTSAQPSELGGVISPPGPSLAVSAGELDTPRSSGAARSWERVQRVDRGARRGRSHRGQRDRLARTPVTVMVTPRPLAHAISQGQPVAQAAVTIGSQVTHIPLDASHAVPPPPLRWLLTRL